MSYELKFKNKKEANDFLHLISNTDIYNKQLDFKKYIDRLYKLLNKQPIKISSRKGKGREFQKEICRQISKLLDIEYNQQDDNCQIKSRTMGLSGVDIILTNEARILFPFSIECKNVEKLNLWESIKQAKSNAIKDEWLLFCKKNNTNPIIIMDIELFFRIYKQFINNNLKFED